MADLFDPITFRGVTLAHRIVIPPMAMYRATPDGCATDWHLVHYGRYALGGASMVMVESTAVEEVGRIGYACLGLYHDRHIAPLKRISDFLRAEGSVPAIQINHTGRKGSWSRPWDGYTKLTEKDAERGEHPWEVHGPSALPVAEGAQVPKVYSRDHIARVVRSWAEAARRADEAGFDILEIHGAHGYLINQFLSPISNHRSDEYGGSLENRMRLPLEIAEAVRAAWPAEKPLFLRVSSVDAVEGGWTMDETVALSHEMKKRGVDLIDCSSGGIGGSATITRVPREPGFQVPFAERVRREVGIPTIAVGLITEAEHAREIIQSGASDLVAIGREALVDPNWPCAARTELLPERGHADWPKESGWWLDRRTMSIRDSQKRRAAS